LIFLDYKVNSYVFIANSIFRSKKELEIITKKVAPLESLESFRITIQEKPKYKNRYIPIRLTPELSKYLGALKKCATCYYYEEENKKTILDFYINPITKKLFKQHYKSAFDLYNSLYKLDLLNEILLKKSKRETIANAEYTNQKHLYPQLSLEDRVFSVENIRVNLSHVNSDLDYYDLSDGEHQLIHVLGSLLMINSPDVLFLLDEPETHFNPQWRSKFISALNEMKHTVKQDFFITTHSPFILGDCKMEHVFIFEKGKARNPSVQTYGLSTERILREAFGVIPPMSEKSLSDIQRLQRSTSYKNIEKRIDDFGESIEKVYLFDRLSELKKLEKKKERKK
jgi:restriction system-associated AAA family ATPase